MYNYKSRYKMKGLSVYNRKKYKYYDKLFQELLEENNSYKDLFAIIHCIVPKVVSRNFKDEDGYLIENKFGYFKNATYSNINKLNFDIDGLWDNDLNDLYSEDDFER